MSIEYLGNGNLQYGPSGPVVYRGSRTGAAASNWWEAGGATGAVAVYQPIGAASLAASYVNLANPGTYDAAPGVAPSWDAVNGWNNFNGLSAYLTTGITPKAAATVLVRIADAINDTDNLYVFGQGGDWPYYFTPRRDSAAGAKWANGGTYNVGAGEYISSGVVGISGQVAYLDGASVGSLAGGSNSPVLELQIGRYNPNGLQTKAKILAFAYYEPALTANQVAAVSTAMAALT